MMIAKWLRNTALFLGLIVASASAASAAVVQVQARGTTSNVGPYSYSDLGGGNVSVVLPSSTLTVTDSNPMLSVINVGDTLTFNGATIIGTFGLFSSNPIPAVITGDNGFSFDSNATGVVSNGTSLSPLPLVAAIYGNVSFNGFSSNAAVVAFFFDTDGSHTSTYEWAMFTPEPATVPEPSSAAIALLLAGSGLFYRWRKNRKA